MYNLAMYNVQFTIRMGSVVISFAKVRYLGGGIQAIVSDSAPFYAILRDSALYNSNTELSEQRETTYWIFL